MAPDDSYRVSLLPNHYPQLTEEEVRLGRESRSKLESQQRHAKMEEAKAAAQEEAQKLFRGSADVPGESPHRIE